MRQQIVFDAPLAPSGFHGRKDLVEQISARLCRPQVQSSTVVGGPRMGKTSLFRYLCSDRADSYFRGKRLIRTYFDAQLVGLNSTEQDFWIGVLRSLSDKPEVKGIVNIVQEKIAKSAVGFLNKFDVFDVFDTFAASGAPVALFVDNFDTPLRNDNFWNGSDFFHNLRFLDERDPRGLCYVVATSRPLRDYWRPAAVSQFFNTWLDFVLGPLSPEEVTEWIEYWLQDIGADDKVAIRQLVRESAYGHPFIVNFVLALCIEQIGSGRPITRTLVEERLGQPEGPGSRLVRRIFAELVPFERDMLRSIAENERLPPAKLRALRRLADIGLLPPGTAIPEEAGQ